MSSNDGDEVPRPLSMLTTLLSSPKADQQRQRSNQSSDVSPSPSPPMAALDSPRMRGDPVSILRRGSLSEGEFHHLASTRPNAGTTTPDQLPELRLVCNGVPSLNSHQLPRPALKFAVATHMSPKRPQCAEEILNSYDEVDPGYEEDSDGDSSDSEADGPPVLLQSRNLALDKALALLDNRAMSPPPPRIYRPSSATDQSPENRGRGHVRVDPSAVQSRQSCSRHCSPPPAEPEPLKPALPGPREGRAGSPVPSCDILCGSDIDEDDNDEGTTRGLCTKDDHELNDSAVLRRERQMRDDSALLSESSDEEPTRGLRQMLRRASEHIPVLRRRSFGWTVGDTRRSSPGSIPIEGNDALRPRSLSTGPIRISNKGNPAARESRSQPLPCPGRLAEKGSNGI